MRKAAARSAWFAAMLLAAGCGLAYQAAAEHRAAKMDQQLQPGLTFAQVAEKFGQPDIEDKPDDTTEIWGYAKRTNRGDLMAELTYTSAKEGDAGTFEDLKFVDGKLVSWSEGQHTMAEKESSDVTVSFGRGGGGGRHGSRNGSANTPVSSGSSSSSEVDDLEGDIPASALPPGQ